VFRSYQWGCRLGCMDAKLTIPVCGLLGEKFSGETPLR